MNEVPKSSELYADYKHLYAELESARQDEIIDDDTDSAEAFRPVLETLDLEIDFHEMDPEEVVYVQELLDMKAEAQNPITKEKIYVKMIRILGAQARLNIHFIIAKNILDQHFNEFYNEATVEDSQHSKF